jgi:hypothetical protein
VRHRQPRPGHAQDLRQGPHHTSFDWLLYCFLAKHFEGDKRVTFLIPDGPDAYYKIYGHRYLLTHGDQFRGGDGMIGALGPIIRGDHKKRSRNSQIDMGYDTLLLGHWHQYIHLTRLIVNGSLKGYDEYAYSNNFPFEQPQQALWLTHPKYGITRQHQVHARWLDRNGLREDEAARGAAVVSVFSAIAMAFVVVGAAVVGWTGLLFHAHNDIGIDGSNVPPPDRDNDGFAAWRSAGSPAAIRSVFVPCQTANGCACPLDWIDGAWECRACGTSDRHHR